MSDLPVYLLERHFAAPRALVWKAWTDPELVPRWYGPGAESIVHKLEAKPGGLWLHEMRWGEKSNFQKVVFLEVDAPAKMVWQQHSSTDADASTSPHNSLYGNRHRLRGPHNPLERYWMWPKSVSVGGEYGA